MAVHLNPSRAIFILIAAGLPVLGGESAILASGARLHVDRHEVADGVVRLFSGGGVTELPANVIVEFEADDPLPVAQPPVPVPAEVVPAAAQPKDPKGLVRGAALRSGLPPAFVESVARTESALNQRAVSPKGALGVMQLMPETARKLGADPTNLEQNIDAGTRLLRDLLVRYNGDVVKALAAYNAGEGAVDRYNGLPPYPETQNYVNKVIHGYLAQPNPVPTDSTPREARSGVTQ